MVTEERTVQEMDFGDMVARLSASHPLFAEATIARWVAREAEKYADARITTFIPVLVERAVRAQLATVEGSGIADLGSTLPESVRI